MHFDIIKRLLNREIVITSVEDVSAHPWASIMVDHPHIISNLRVDEFRKVAEGRIGFRDDDRRCVLFEHESDAILWRLSFTK